MPDAERVQDPTERARLRALDLLEEVRGALLGIAVERHQLLDGEGEEVRRVPDEPALEQRGDGRPAGTLDIQRTREVPDTLPALRRTRRVPAAIGDLALRVLDGAIADRAALGHPELRVALPLHTFVVLHPDDLGDDVAGALDDDGVPGADIEATHLVQVVERRALHRRATDEDWCERGDRRERSHPPDVHEDVLHRRGRLLGRELERDGPAGAARHVSEGHLVCDRVNLHDDPVGAVVELVPPAFPALREGPDRVDVRAALPVRVRPEPELAQALQELTLRADREPGAALSSALGPGSASPGGNGAVDPHREIASGGLLWVELPHRAGGGVPRIREEWLPPLAALAVRRLEGRGGQVHLAAHVHAAGEPLPQSERDRADGPEVRGDVLPHQAVAPRRAAREPPVLVGEVHREAVDFQLADVPDIVPA